MADAANVIDDTTTAAIGDGVSVQNAGDVTLDADASSAVTAEARMGAAGGGVHPEEVAEPDEHERLDEQLQRDWAASKGLSRLDWQRARQAALRAWERGEPRGM